MPTMSAAFLPLNDSTGLEGSLTGTLLDRRDTGGITSVSRTGRLRPRAPRVNARSRATWSGGEVLGVHVVDELPELLDHLLGLLLVGLLDPAGLIEDLLLGVDRRPDADGQRDGVRRPAGHRPDLAVCRERDLRVERAVPQRGDRDALDPGADLLEQVLHEVVGHRARGLDLLQGQRDRLRFGGADEDREDAPLTRGLAQDDDRGARGTLWRLDAHEFHLDGHRRQPYSHSADFSCAPRRFVVPTPRRVTPAVRGAAGRAGCAAAAPPASGRPAAPARRPSRPPAGGPPGSAA